MKPALLLEKSPGQLVVRRAGGKEPLLVQNARPDTRPYLHPIVAPDGRGILTEDTPPHHPWQHGLYVGLNGVNGVGFWTENAGKDGTFHPRELSGNAEGHHASWLVVSDWKTPPGDVLLEERQAWSLDDQGDYFLLDLDWTLKASADITFAQYAYGGLFIRMPYRKEKGGVALNSEGLKNEACEAQRARWVGISMPVEGRANDAGMALMDHPANPEHPVPWRVDYELGVAPSRCIAGEWRLREGASITCRHRVFIFTGSVDAARIESIWDDYQKS